MTAPLTIAPATLGPCRSAHATSVPVVEPSPQAESSAGRRAGLPIRPAAAAAFAPDSPQPGAGAGSRLATIRHSRRPTDPPDAGPGREPAFAREVDLVAAHLRADPQPAGPRRVVRPRGVPCRPDSVERARRAGRGRLRDPLARARRSRRAPALRGLAAESASGPVRLPANGDPTDGSSAWPDGDRPTSGRRHAATASSARRYPSRMRLSQLFFTSLRDDPADAEMPSHRLLVRAGYVRQLGSGIYSLLPLG